MESKVKSTPKKLSKENKAHRKAQAEARATKKSIIPQGFRGNPLPNRKTRRAQAQSKNRETWGEANEKWKGANVQTITNPEKQAAKKARREARLKRKAERKEAKGEVSKLPNRGKALSA